MSMFSGSGTNNLDTAQTKLEVGGDKAIRELQSGMDKSNSLLNPYLKIGQDSLSRLNLLNDPNAQQDYLNNNQLLQQSIQNANTAIGSSAAARGRLTAGDTQTALVNSSAGLQNQFLNQEQQNIMNQLGFGLGITNNQVGMQNNLSANIADIITSVASGGANTSIAHANAKQQSNADFMNLAGSVFGAVAMSDVRLKTNIKEIGTMNGFKKYSWSWNKEAEKLGLVGESEGVIAQEVEKTHPDLVIEDESGYKKVKYGEM